MLTNGIWISPEYQQSRKEKAKRPASFRDSLKLRIKCIRACLSITFERNVQ